MVGDEAGDFSDLDFYFTPNDYGAAGSADYEVAVQDAINRVQSPTDYPIAYYDPNTGNYSSAPISNAVPVPSPAAFQSASDRIRSDPELSQLIIDPSSGTITRPDGTVVETGTPLYQKFLGALGETGSFLNSVMRTPLGAALTTLGLGALGQGIGRAVAGGPQSLVLPPPTAGQNPALLAGGQLTLDALSDPATRANFSLAIQRAIEGQASGAGVINDAIRREGAIGAATGPQTQAMRTLAVNEMPGFLTNADDVANFSNLAASVGPELARLLSTETAYPTSARPGSTAEMVKLPVRTDAYGSLGANYDRLAAIYQQVQQGQLADEGAIRSAIGVVPGMSPDEINALVATMRGGLGSRTTQVAPNPLDQLLQAKAAGLITGGPNDFALPGDPVEQAMQARLLRAIEGGEVDPGTERAISEGLEILRNKLKQAYGTTGAEWDSTLGQNLYLKGQESANATRYAINRDVINSVGPQQQARRTFQITNPQEMYLGETSRFLPAAQTSTAFNQTARAQNEQLRQSAMGLLSGVYSGALRDATATKAGGLAQRQSLATFNPTNMSTVASGINTLGGVANIPTYSNLNDAGSRSSIDAARNNATLAAFNADAASRAAQAKSISNLFGTAAGAATGSGMLRNLTSEERRQLGWAAEGPAWTMSA